jgi:TRAP-type mannitol/chloroaromatic compound transport system permease large subunit
VAVQGRRSETRAGYDVRMSAGTITAGGTLGIFIPPSVMLVVMGPVMGVSVAKLYASSLLPLPTGLAAASERKPITQQEGTSS